MSSGSKASFQPSRIGFGCWQLGSKGTSDYWGLEFTDKLADELISLAASKGITYFDTAEGYADGESESQLKRALAKLDSKTRSKIVLGSKILPNNCLNCRKSLEATLKRLDVSCIDLYMVHWPISAESMAHFAGDHKTESGGLDYAKSDKSAVGEVPPVTKAFEELIALQKEGKIRNIGVSNFGVKQLKEALSTGVTIAVNQIAYNLLFRAGEMEVIPFCVKNGIQILAYSPLMQGLLVGRYKSVKDVPQYRARTRHFDSRTNPKSRHGENGCEALLFKTVESVAKIAQGAGISMAELALAWPLHQQGVACVIAGATKSKQVEGNARAAQLKLSESTLKALDEATRELKEAMGPNLDLWQGVVNGKQTSRCE